MSTVHTQKRNAFSISLNKHFSLLEASLFCYKLCLVAVDVAKQATDNNNRRDHNMSFS